MALTAAVTHASPALPRRRHRRAATPSTHLAPPLSTSTRPATLDCVLSDLEAQPRLLTPSHLAHLLVALLLHPSPRRRLAASCRKGIGRKECRRQPITLSAPLAGGLESYLTLRAITQVWARNLLLGLASRLGRSRPSVVVAAGGARVAGTVTLYLQMDEEGAPRDGFTFESAPRACAGARSAELGRAVHRDALSAGLAAVVSVCDALVEMYAQCGDMESARKVFDAMPSRGTGLSPQATEVWRRMLGEGHKPDSVVLSTMLCHHPDDGKQGPEVHAWVIRHGLDTALSVANSLIGMYSRKNELGHALSVFESMPVRDLASWNAIISGHSQDFRVLMMFRRMVDSGVRTDETTFAAVLFACDNLGLVEGGMRLFSEMENKYRIQPTVQHCTSGEHARQSWDAPTVLRALLHASSVHGNIKIGEIAAKKLFDLEPDNAHNFFTRMKMYGNTGRLEDLEKVKKMMRDKGL
ncbi:hypothetical protein VPH35_094522 [Triticum aestivum]